jgi:hypothetical protein
MLPVGCKAAAKCMAAVDMLAGRLTGESINLWRDVFLINVYQCLTY